MNKFNTITPQHNSLCCFVLCPFFKELMLDGCKILQGLKNLKSLSVCTFIQPSEDEKTEVPGCYCSQMNLVVSSSKRASQPLTWLELIRLQREAFLNTRYYHWRNWKHPGDFIFVFTLRLYLFHFRLVTLFLGKGIYFFLSVIIVSFKHRHTLTHSSSKNRCCTCAKALHLLTSQPQILTFIFAEFLFRVVCKWSKCECSGLWIWSKKICYKVRQ